MNSHTQMHAHTCTHLTRPSTLACCTVQDAHCSYSLAPTALRACSASCEAAYAACSCCSCCWVAASWVCAAPSAVCKHIHGVGLLVRWKKMAGLGFGRTCRHGLQALWTACCEICDTHKSDTVEGAAEVGTCLGPAQATQIASACCMYTRAHTHMHTHRHTYTACITHKLTKQYATMRKA